MCTQFTEQPPRLALPSFTNSLCLHMHIMYILTPSTTFSIRHKCMSACIYLLGMMALLSTGMHVSAWPTLILRLHVQVSKGLTHIKYNKYAPSAEEAAAMTSEQFRAVIYERMRQAEQERRRRGPIGGAVSDDYIARWITRIIASHSIDLCATTSPVWADDGARPRTRTRRAESRKQTRHYSLLKLYF